MLGARLYILTGNVTYLTKSKQVYSWLKQIGLVSTAGHTYDGVNSDCKVPKTEHSYVQGMTVGALGWMYKATGDASYLTDGSTQLNVTLSLYVQNNIVTDLCEPVSCQANQVQPKGTMMRGLGYYAAFTNNVQDTARIQNVLGASVGAMLKTCDSNMNCGSYWNKGFPAYGDNFHYQVNAMELMNAYSESLNGGLGIALDAPEWNGDAAAPMQNSGVVDFCSLALIVGFVLFAL